jgi:hypothetical protein
MACLAGWNPFHLICFRKIGPFPVQGNESSGIPKNAVRVIELDDPPKPFVAKLLPLADCIDQVKRFRIPAVRERILILHSAEVRIEHERNESREEIEFQPMWRPHEHPQKVAAKKPRNRRPE